MAKKQRKTSKIKVKKKLWVPVYAPSQFGKKHLGDSYLGAPEQAVGRRMEVNLRDLTGEMRDQSAYIHFAISSVKDNQLHTQPVAYKLAASQVKRMVRKNRARIDHVFTATTKAGLPVTVKALLIGRYRTQRSTKTQLRLALQQAISEQLEKGSFGQFVDAVVKKKYLLGLKKQLSKIFPLRDVVLRVIELKRAEEPVAEEETSVTEETSQPEEQEEVAEE